jgi:enoyl-CoA hydratase/carnithine racemase
MQASSLVETSRTDGVVTLRFNRPDDLNAVNLELLREFRDELEDLVEDPAGVLVVTGKGDVTCAGMDTEVVSDEEYHEKFADEIIRLNEEVQDFLTEYPYPTIMAAKGALIGEAFFFSLYFDFVVAGEETKLSLPEIKYGISTAEGLPLLADIVGLRAAKDIAMTGEPIDPERAHNLGLVSEVVSESEVDDTAQDLAAELAGYDNDILQEMKETVPITG